MKKRVATVGKRRDSTLLYVTYVTGVCGSFFIGLGIVSGLLASLILMSFVSEEMLNSILNLVIPMSLIGGSFWFVRLIQKKHSGRSEFSAKELLYLKKPNKKAIWLIPVIAIGYFIVLIIAISVLAVLNPQAASQEQEVAKEVAKLVGWQIPISIIGVGLMTPIAEELFFRGLLTNLYARRVNRMVAVVLVALLFGIAHAQLNAGIDTFIFGVFLGVLTWKTESIYPAIFLHMAKNCIALSVILN